MDESRPLRSTRRLQNLTSALPRWYNVAAPAAADAPTLVSIYDEIGFYGVSAGTFMADLDAITGPIEMHINSPGGDIYEGITIYNRLKQRKGDLHVIVDGLAASAASFIAMAASPGKLEMAPRSEMMIHNGFTMAIGDAADLRKTADLLEKKTADIAGMYAERSGKPAAYWLTKMAAETWLSADETVAEGLADRIHGQADTDPADQWDMSVFAKFAGAHLQNADGSDAMPGDDCPTCKGSGKIMKGNRKCPDCDGSGKVKDPDGDDDTTAKGDTDHDYVKPDGSPGPKAKPAGNQALGFPVLAADVDNSAWDASKAWHAGSESDDPAAFYKGICAGRKAGDPSTQDAWALPYKYSPSSPPNAAGVRNALARLGQTQGLTNEAQARSTLEKAMKAVNPDYDPDDLIDPGLLASVFSICLEGATK